MKTKLTAAAYLGFLTTAFIVFNPAPVRAANTIISDAFTGANGASVPGRTPDTTNLPGATYYGDIQTSTIDNTAGNPANSANTGFNSRTMISIGSAGSYVKPSVLTISADLQMNGLTDGGGFIRGLGLGFYPIENNTGVVNGSSLFTGLAVKPDGTLALVLGGVQQAASVVPFSGYSTATFYNLSYSISTATGSITNVVFNGNNDTATFSGATTAGDFTDAGTNFVGFYGSSAVAGAGGHVDNFVVSSTAPVPEPSSAVLLFGGLGALLARRKRRSA